MNNPDRRGVQLLARVFHDLISGKTNPEEQKLIKLIESAVNTRLKTLDNNVYSLAKTGLEMAERITALEDCVDQLVAEASVDEKELPEWVH